jgi:hypothetical protein
VWILISSVFYSQTFLITNNKLEVILVSQITEIVCCTSLVTGDLVCYDKKWSMVVTLQEIVLTDYNCKFVISCTVYLLEFFK